MQNRQTIKGHLKSIITALAILIFLGTGARAATDPFASSNGLKPTQSQYSGPYFKLSHKWPKNALSPISNPPWSQAIGGGLITTNNAAKYVATLKDSVSGNARRLFLDYPNWNAEKAQWFNEPWLGSIRESVHGTYAAGTFGTDVFPGTGLKTTFDTHVLTYYDERSAYTLFKTWGSTAANPNVKTENFQFDEGAVIVKAAIFVSDDPTVQTNWWSVTAGAAPWPLFVPIGGSTNPVLVNGFVMQFDIIVKDTVAAPKTGWVFSTLVYDKDAPGKDAWDKMVPLGAMWGNDPNVDSAANPNAPLNENWINPSAPMYSTQTLGWGGRLSGPNDGARNDIWVDGKPLKNTPDSSCISCHSPAQWQPQLHKMVSFLLPSFPSSAPGGPPFQTCGPNGDYICSPAPASADWMRWFQNRPGTVAMDPATGSVATDFDMVFAFKTLPMWAKSVKGGPEPFAMRTFKNKGIERKRYNEYTGAPLKNQK